MPERRSSCARDVCPVFKAYPFTKLKRTSTLLIDRVNGRTIRIHFNRQTQSAFVTNASGKPIPIVTAFHFAWYTFHP